MGNGASSLATTLGLEAEGEYTLMAREERDSHNRLTQLLRAFSRRSLDTETPECLRRFTIAELERATKNFLHMVGDAEDGLAQVYKGALATVDGAQLSLTVKRMVDDTQIAAGKPATSSYQDKLKRLRKEIEVLSGLRHRSIVHLLGYAYKRERILLVYAFGYRGTLYDFLRRERELNEEGKGGELLTWEQRLKIAFRVAQGLDYIHNEVSPPVIHRDIRPSNILLSPNYDARIAGFGSAVIGTSHIVGGLQGCPGYIDPEYSATSRPTPQGDVYSLGVVMLELATGWPYVGGPENQHILRRVALEVSRSGFNSIVATSIRGQQTTACRDSNSSSTMRPSGNVVPFSLGVFQRFVKLAMQCCSRELNARPGSRMIAVALQEMMNGRGDCFVEDGS